MVSLREGDGIENPSGYGRAVHELSICRSLADIVERHAEGRQVTGVRVQVGHFRQVVPATPPVRNVFQSSSPFTSKAYTKRSREPK